MPTLFLVALLCLSLPGSGIREAVGAEPSTPPAVAGVRGGAEYSKAEAAFFAKRWPEAEELFRRFIGSYPGSVLLPDAFLRLAEILLRRGNESASYHILNGVLSAPVIAEETRTHARLILAGVLLDLKRREEALGEIAATDDSPLSGSDEAQRNLLRARIRLEENDPAGALEFLAQAIGKTPSQGEGGDPLGELWARAAGGLSDLPPLEKLLAMPLPGDLSGYLEARRAILLDEAGRWVESREAAEAFLEKRPDHPEAGRIRELSRLVSARLEVDLGSVGLLLPLTGRYGPIGRQASNGVELAAMEIDLSRMRAPLQIVIRDTQGDPDKTVEGLDDLFFNKHVAVVIGPILSVAAEAAVKRADELGVPLITLTRKEGLTESKTFAFRNFPSLSKQIRALVRHAYRVKGCRKFAILAPYTPPGFEMKNLFWDELDRFGLPVVGMEYYGKDQTDFRRKIGNLIGLGRLDARAYQSRKLLKFKGYKPYTAVRLFGGVLERLAQRLAGGPAFSAEDGGEPSGEGEKAGRKKKKEDRGPPPVVDFDALFLPDHAKNTALIAPQLDFNDVLGVQLLGTEQWNRPDLAEKVGRYMEGAVFVSDYLPGDPTDPASLESRYASFYQSDLTIFSQKAHESLMIAVSALQDEKIVDRRSLRKSLVWSGAGSAPRDGYSIFDEEGEDAREPFILTIEHNKITLVR